ncbi:MAG: MaoC/PaaZ C-terminal domain-containing protein [Dehalococcoidia bacterium]
MTIKYFDDFIIGERETIGSYTVDKDEVIEFSKLWDPQPFHVDEEAAKASHLKGIIAPFGYTMGIVIRLAHQNGMDVSTAGGLGIDEVRFPLPVRPGNRITVVRECVLARDSDSMPDYGILTLKMEVTNQHGDIVLTYKVTMLAEKRPEIQVRQ